MRFWLVEREWQAALELNGEAIESLFPIFDRHGPFFGGLFNGQGDHLEGGTITGENPSVVDGLANHTVKRLNGVRCVDGAADVVKVVKDRYDLLPGS